MCAVNKRPVTGSPMQINGQGNIEFSYRDGRTNLFHLYQSDPIRVLFPNVSSEEIKQGIIVTTSGGLVGGDKISLALTFGEKTSAMIMAQAAEKVYGSSEATCLMEIDLEANTHAWAEYLPQETILFDNARLNRTTRIRAAAGSQVLAGEIVVFGRKGSGETFSSGYLRDSWEVWRDNKLVWIDTLLLEKNIPQVFNHPACLKNINGVATIVFISDNVGTYLDYARNLIKDPEENIRMSVSVTNGVLIARFMGEDPLNLRNAFGNFWQNFRHHVASLPNSLPRLWHI